MHQQVNVSSSSYDEQIVGKDESQSFKNEQSNLILSQGLLSILKLSSVMNFTDYLLDMVFNTEKSSIN